MFPLVYVAHKGLYGHCLSAAEDMDAENARAGKAPRKELWRPALYLPSGGWGVLRKATTPGPKMATEVIALLFTKPFLFLLCWEKF